MNQYSIAVWHGVSTAHPEQSTRSKGFSLPELLIAIAILGILAAIAIPSYAEHLRSARRTDATLSLIDLAGRLERHYTNTGSYATATIATDTATDVLSSNTTTESYYTLSIIADDTTANAFKIKATRKSGSAQSADARCGDFTLTDSGIRTISGSGTVAECW